MAEPIYTFVPTGEVRPPKKGEWVQLGNGDFVQADYDWEGTRPIFTLTEIPVPEGATNFGYQFKTKDSWYGGRVEIPLPLAQPEKKYRYRICVIRNVWCTTDPMTDAEADAMLKALMLGSEVDFERIEMEKEG